MAGGGGGGDVFPVSHCAEQPRRGGRRRHKAPEAACLPLDVIVEEIAARSDAATLVRCAATCRDARRRIAEDPNLRGRLRLRDTGRFLLPLLRGHLVAIHTDDVDDNLGGMIDVYLADTDTTAADATRLVKATLAESDTLRDAVPMDSRGGLVLARAISMAHPLFWEDQLLVSNPATRRHQELPLEPDFPLHVCRGMDVQFVLLVGDSDDGEAGAAVGRPFQVLMAKLVLSEHHRCDRRLLLHTFSSEHGAWSPLMEIPTPDLHGSAKWPSLLHHKTLVVGDVVHWLCLTDGGSYLLMLHVRAAQVNVTALPASFPRDSKPCQQWYHYQYLLETASAGGNPVVLVAGEDKISAWEQSKRTKMWGSRVVMEKQDIPLAKHAPCYLVSFAERSGVVLLWTHEDGSRLLWLDLHSNKIVRCCSGDQVSYLDVFCPYEVDSSSWVPTFSRAGTF